MALLSKFVYEYRGNNTDAPQENTDLNFEILKMCPFFVGSVHNVRKGYEKVSIVYLITIQISNLSSVHVKCPTRNSNLERTLVYICQSI